MLKKEGQRFVASLMATLTLLSAASAAARANDEKIEEGTKVEDEIILTCITRVEVSCEMDGLFVRVRKEYSVVNREDIETEHDENDASEDLE